MSRIGRILPLGAALMVASCADGTGPPDQLDQQPLGAISGPGVSSTELHPLMHRMSVVFPDGLPLFQTVSQSSAESPPLETYELSFWAKRGNTRTAEIHYMADDPNDTNRFLSFHVPSKALLLRPDGTPFAKGDSVLISIRIDQSEYVVEFGPSGLVFDETEPAELEVWYGGAQGEVPQEQLGLWHQQEAGLLWFPIVSHHDEELRWFKTNVFHFSTYAVSW